MADLKSRRCKPLEGQPPMTAALVEAHLASVAGISINDFICAAKADALLP